MEAPVQLLLASLAEIGFLRAYCDFPIRIIGVDWVEDLGVLRRRDDREAREGPHAASRRSRAEMRGVRRLSWI